MAAALELVRPLRHVVDDAVAGDVIHRLRLFHVASGLADDDAKLDFPVDLLGARRHLDVVVRTDDRAGRLEEQDRLRRNGHARLRGVVRIVEADADHLADGVDARPEAGAALDERQTVDVDGRQPGQAGLREHSAIDVFHVRGKIACQTS